MNILIIKLGAIGDVIRTTSILPGLKSKYNANIDWVTKQESFDVLKFSFKCSSGGYVRSLVASLGEKLGTKAVAYSIKRVKIGEYNLNSCQI